MSENVNSPLQLEAAEHTTESPTQNTVKSRKRSKSHVEEEDVEVSPVSKKQYFDQMNGLSNIEDGESYLEAEDTELVALLDAGAQYGKVGTAPAACNGRG